jgi:hypothetical protein
LKRDFAFVWFGDRCSPGKRKRLSKLWRRWQRMTPHNTLILDNSPETYASNYGNAIAIPTYTLGHEKDVYLRSLCLHMDAWMSEYEQQKTNPPLPRRQFLRALQDAVDSSAIAELIADYAHLPRRAVRWVREKRTWWM